MALRLHALDEKTPHVTVEGGADGHLATRVETEEAARSGHRYHGRVEWYRTVNRPPRRAAVRHLAQRGGTIINIGSVVSDRAVPLQGM